LDQIGLRQAITGIATSDMDDKPQMRHNQLARSFQIALLLQTFSNSRSSAAVSTGMLFTV